MDNKVYYGEYTLYHWINLIIKKNIILPEYQRFFVWDKEKVKTLIDTFKKKQFVPPVTIGAFKDDNKYENLILDGQQRLTSILLAYLGIFPNKKFKKFFPKNKEDFADENDDQMNKEQFDNILEWRFDELFELGNNKSDIVGKTNDEQYHHIDFGTTEDFFKNTFLGFSYLVPQVDDDKAQQKFYSSVFRNINIQGESLSAQESRQALYYLDQDKVKYFDPDFSKKITVKNTKVDFVRFLALLSQYYKEQTTDNIAKGFFKKIEKYYEDYIYTVVGEVTTKNFAASLRLFNVWDSEKCFDKLDRIIDDLNFYSNYDSIINLDIYFFGLIYFVLFKNKEIEITKKSELKEEIEEKIKELKEKPLHQKNPSAFKYLRLRIKKSIEIYSRYKV